MTRCTTCGTVYPDDAGVCSRCGADVAGNGDATVVIRPREPGAGSHSTSQPHLTSTAEDEGRFVPGTLVAGRYRIIGLLGRGGMGEVYRATDLTLGQSVALKFLPEHAGRDERLLERFHHEVRTARQVTHPNVCRVYDIGEADGHPFISMEYVDGEDLASLLQRIGRLPAGKALQITRELCAGLAAAHDRGVIHRDLKPHNVMLNKRGSIVIMDFGLAAITDELSGKEVRSGTPAYMAPEQLRGDAVTVKSDLYSLGLMTYELFTGRRAFEAESVMELLDKEETSLPASMVEVAPDVDPAVEDVVLRCLQPDPRQRPGSARAIAAALPGGDPLAAALAAGETPSPEVVAASGRVQGMALRYAAPCLALVLAGLLVYPWLVRAVSLYALAPMEFPQAVLEQKARDIGVAFGFAARPLDWTSRFQNNSDAMDYLGARRGTRSWSQLFAALSPVEFWYRQSPHYLISYPDGLVQYNRPPADEPGMLRVLLDSRGRVRRFEAVAPRFDESAAPSAFDPATALAAAGLELSKFREVTPSFLPSAAFDSRAAWTGPYPGVSDVPITVEIATWRGRVTSFFIRWPWTKNDTSAQPRSTLQTALTVFYFTMCGIGLFSAAFFARRNLRLGRGDRTGARRVATAALLLSVGQYAAALHIVPVFDLIGFAFERFAVSLLFAAVIWLLYIALEPAVRARWPQTLITWNRLAAGRWQDPVFASHVLIGITFAVAWIGLFVAHIYWASGGHPDGPDPYLLGGARPLIYKLCMRASNALLWGSAIFFVLCGVRAVVRNDWAAIAISSVLLTFVEGTVRNSKNLAFDVPMFIALYVAFSLILTRVGLIPAIVSIFALNTVGDMPVGADFAAWFNWISFVEMALIAAIAVWAFQRSQASVPARDTITAFRQTPRAVTTR